MERRKKSKVKFSKKIYKRKAIKEAISAYSSLAEFGIRDGEKHLEVNISCLEPEFKETLVDEFTNYVLGMTKKCF